MGGTNPTEPKDTSHSVSSDTYHYLHLEDTKMISHMAKFNYKVFPMHYTRLMISQPKTLLVTLNILNSHQ